MWLEAPNHNYNHGMVRGVLIYYTDICRFFFSSFLPKDTFINQNKTSSSDISNLRSDPSETCLYHERPGYKWWSVIFPLLVILQSHQTRNPIICDHNLYELCSSYLMSYIHIFKYNRPTMYDPTSHIIDYCLSRIMGAGEPFVHLWLNYTSAQITFLWKKGKKRDGACHCQVA